MRELSTPPDASAVVRALALAARNDRLRHALLEALRQAEAEAEDPGAFREAVRWPLLHGMLWDGNPHRVTLRNGLVFEVGLDSRIERALLLSRDERPDHVWEPQTTKLLVALAAEAEDVIVGGAYIGDHVLPIALALQKRAKPGRVHAFEPMEDSFARLRRNLDLNGVGNVVAHRMALWDGSAASLELQGPAALASTVSAGAAGAEGEQVPCVTIDEYTQANQVPAVGLIMLDTEGAEEKALAGAQALLSRPAPAAPHLVFEVHRHYTDWARGLHNTSVAKRLVGLGYEVFGIRDLHDNYAMGEEPVEIVPAARVYLEGPPHGFNVLATKDRGLPGRLGLRVVCDVSPKLLLHSTSPLHRPSGGFPGARQ